MDPVGLLDRWDCTTTVSERAVVRPFSRRTSARSRFRLLVTGLRVPLRLQRMRERAFFCTFSSSCCKIPPFHGSQYKNTQQT